MKKIIISIIVLICMTMSIQADTQFTVADALRNDIMNVDVGYLNYTKDIDNEMKSKVEDLYKRFEALPMDDKMGLGTYTLDRLYLLITRTHIQTGWGANLAENLDERYGFQHTIPFSVYDFITFRNNIYFIQISESPIIQTDTNLVFDFSMINSNTGETITEFNAPILFKFIYPQYNLVNVTLDGKPIPYSQQACYIYIAVDHPGRIEISFKKTHNFVTGWTIVNYDWFYLDEKGIPYEGWIASGKDWYYTNYLGYMQRSFPVRDTSESESSDSEYSYFVDANGKMIHDSWYNFRGKWYYLQADGKMIKDQQNVMIHGKAYSFNKNGEMLEHH